MPQTTYEKNSSPRSITYDNIQTMDMDTYTVVASQANTAVQTYAPLPLNVKIFGCAIVASSSTSGVTAFNIVMGIGAESGVAAIADNSEAVGWPPYVQVNGTSLFTTDQAVTLVAGVPQSFAATTFDAIWPKNALLTLRVVSGGAVNGIIKVKLLFKPYDIQPQSPGKFNRPIQFSDL